MKMPSWYYEEDTKNWPPEMFAAMRILLVGAERVRARKDMERKGYATASQTVERVERNGGQ